MNVSIFLEMDYENISDWTLGQNKPNSNPIKPNCQKSKIDAKSVFTKDYRKKDDFAVQKTKPKQTQFPKSQKMNANAFSQKDYENKTAFRPQKNKPKQTQFKPCPELAVALSAAEGAVEWANFKRGRLLIDRMLPLYKPGNVQYYSRHNFKVKFPKISIISILRQAKLTKYRWKITPAAAIFNPIKKLTTTQTGANLKDRRVIWRFESLLIWGIGTYFLGR